MAIRRVSYDEYMQAAMTKAMIADNENLREMCHRMTFELENLRAELDRSEAIRYSQQERLVTALAGYEEMEEFLNRPAPAEGER